MATSTLDIEIRSRIDAFLAELSTLIKQAALDSVREALGDGSTPMKRGPGRPPKAAGARPGRPAKAKRGKRTTEEVDEMAERIQSFVKAHPGLGLEAIAAGIGTSTKELKLPVIKLLSQRALKKTGQKRGTKYFAGGRAAGAGKAASKRAKASGKKGRTKSKRAARKAPVAAAA